MNQVLDFLVVIPARYQSSRLPGKPLVKISGEPMILRTYKRCLQAAPADKILVATDDVRIQEFCVNHGIGVILTSDSCETGTDRVAEVAMKIEARTYINVQGDEPIFNPEDLKTLINLSAKYPKEILNGYAPIDSEQMFFSVNTPKVVFKPDGQLLYMSRASIPFNKSSTFISAHRQVCAYAFPRDALLAFADSEGKSPLEEIEDIEILRFLELGYDVKMIEMSDVSVAVDVPEDVDKVEAAIERLGIRQ